MVFESEEITERMDEIPPDQFFKSHLGKSVDVHSVSGHKLGEGLDLLGRTRWIFAEKRLDAERIVDPGLPAADRAGLRHGHISRLCKILPDLGNDHVGFVDQDLISDSQPQFLHDTDVMHRRPAYRRSLQLHRFKYGDRVDQSGPGRAPLYIQKAGLRLLVPPLEGVGIPGEPGGRAQRVPISDIVIEGYQAIGRDLKVPDLLFKVVHGPVQSVRCSHYMLYDLKTLFFQKMEMLHP